MKKKCPLINGKCLEAGCHFWTRLRGTHPQTGASVEDDGCAIAFLPVLLIEGAKETRQTGAAVESFRNEMVRANDRTMVLANKMPRLAGGS